MTHLSVPSLLDNPSPPADRDAPALQPHSSVPLWSILEVLGGLVDPENQEHLNDLEDQAERDQEDPRLLSDLSLQGNPEIQADPPHRRLGGLEFLEVLSDLGETGEETLDP